MYNLKYYSEFYSSESVKYRIEILSKAAVLEAKEITLAYDTATLSSTELGQLEDRLFHESFSFTAISDENFQFHSLYSSDMFANKVRLYKSDNLIYTGFVDAETYEEDYTAKTDYEVAISCGNLSILKRIDNEFASIQKLSDIVSKALSYIDITDITFDTTKQGQDKFGNNIAIKDMYISAEIFNRGDEKYTYYEILEELCTALNLYIYVVNNQCIVTDKTKYSLTHGIENLIINEASLSVSPTYKSISLVYDADNDNKIADVNLSDDNTNIETAVKSVQFQVPEFSSVEDYTVKYYNIENKDLTITNDFFYTCRSMPNMGGQDTKFIASHTWFSGNVVDGGSEHRNAILCYYDNAEWGLKKIYESNLIPVTNALTDKMLNLRAEILISAKWNSFEEAAKENDKGDDERFQNRCNLIYLPCNLYLTDSTGAITHYYDNSAIVTTNAGWNANIIGWQKVTALHPIKNGKYWLCYYDNRKNSTPFKNSFATNSLGCGYTPGSEKIPYRYEQMKSKGDLINLPPQEGYLKFEQLTGMEAFDYGKVRAFDSSQLKQIWYKGISLSYTDNYGVEDKSDDEFVYKLTLDKEAEEDKEITTIIGNKFTNEYSKGNLLHKDGLGKYQNIVSFTNGLNENKDLLAVKVLEEYDNLFSLKRSMITAKTKLTDTCSNYISSYFDNKNFVLCFREQYLDSDQQKSIFKEF